MKYELYFDLGARRFVEEVVVRETLIQEAKAGNLDAVFTKELPTVIETGMDCLLNHRVAAVVLVRTFILAKGYSSEGARDHIHVDFLETKREVLITSDSALKLIANSANDPYAIPFQFQDYRIDGKDLVDKNPNIKIVRIKHEICRAGGHGSGMG